MISNSAQIEEEMEGIFGFLQDIYGMFGLTFKLELSTRPEKFLGEIAAWDAAEKVLVHRSEIT